MSAPPPIELANLPWSIPHEGEMTPLPKGFERHPTTGRIKSPVGPPSTVVPGTPLPGAPRPAGIIVGMLPPPPTGRLKRQVACNELPSGPDTNKKK